MLIATTHTFSQPMISLYGGIPSKHSGSAHGNMFSGYIQSTSLEEHADVPDNSHAKNRVCQLQEYMHVRRVFSS